ncbi:MAG: permease [Candidatus Thermoplasmatota archaeon]|nr:permease [Candidatus Thermoplasmatota archaeon]MBS3789779.1 permease [Candidatus Thermoplasmatota archaeon]
MLRDWLIFAGMVVVAAVLIYLYPSKQEPVISASFDYLSEMIFILPAVMVLMGLFSVYIPKDTVVKYFGKASGIKGFFLAILFGTLPTGPLYVAFPMASTMIKKGARISNIVMFLSAWACIKIPQEMVELQFLGPEFMLARLFLTIIFVGLMGLVIEWIIDKTGGEED